MNWPVSTLGKIANLTMGGTPNTKREDYYVNGNINWMKSGEIKGDYIYNIKNTITQSGLDSSNAKIYPINSVVIALNGQGKTRATTAVLKVETASNQSVACIEAERTIMNPIYIHYYLKMNYKNLRNITGDNARSGLNLTILRNYTIPVPPISEQNRIVKILDQAVAIKDKRKEADEMSKRLISSLFYDMFGDPSSFSNEKTIKDLVKKISTKDPRKEPGIRFNYIDISGINTNTGSIERYKNILSEEAPSRARKVVKTKDVIISTVRPYLQATAIVPEKLNNEICSTGFCVLRSINNFGFGFLYAYSRTSWFKDSLMKVAKGASYPAVSDKDVLSLPIPKSVNDRKIMKNFDSFINQLSNIENQKQISVNKINSLYDTLLHRAFLGVLTSKWREAHMKELLQEMEEQSKYLNQEN